MRLAGGSPGRGEADRRPGREAGRRRPARLGEPAVRTLAALEERCGRGERERSRRDGQQVHVQTTSVRRWRPRALEQPSQLRPRGEREHEVPARVREVERDAAAELHRERGPRVRVERVPLPEVHQHAEGEAEHEAERPRTGSGGGRGARRARRSPRSRPRPASATASTGPGRGRSSRRARRRRRPRSPARAPSATPAAITITVTGCTPGTAAKRTRPAAATPPSVPMIAISFAELGPVSSQAAPPTTTRGGREQEREPRVARLERGQDRGDERRGRGSEDHEPRQGRPPGPARRRARPRGRRPRRRTRGRG